jgi:hypothetical protein
VLTRAFEQIEESEERPHGDRNVAMLWSKTYIMSFAPMIAAHA